MSMTSVARATASTSDVSVPSAVAARFLVQGPADPGLLPRLLEPFAKLGQVPSRVHASREEGDGSVLTVDLRLGGLEARTAELIELGLRRVVGIAHLIAVVEPQAAVG